MTLGDYLRWDRALSVAQLAQRIGAANDQVRQWQHGYAGRQPGARYCVAIEQATGGVVRRQDLRPKDWHLIWPELIGIEGAPDVEPEPESNGA
jgi:DNA-binding transcriptional regulator YdaS (Cro superfamily)